MGEFLQKLLYKEKILFAVILIWALMNVFDLPSRSAADIKKATATSSSSYSKPVRGVDNQKLKEFVNYVVDGRKPAGAPSILDTTDDTKKPRIDLAKVKSGVAEYSKSDESKSLYWRQVEIQGLGLLNLKPPASTDTKITDGLLADSPDFTNIRTTFRIGNLVASTFE